MKANVDSFAGNQIPAEREISVPPLPAVKIGRIAAISPSLGPLIDFPDNQTGELVAARAFVNLTYAQIGNEVALAFEDGDATKPIILGVLYNPQEQTHDSTNELAVSSSELKPDQESIVLSAARDLTLVCGKASITLTNAGKILLRGAYLLSRSSGVNRIKGGSVQIN
jgi:Domain of unknown function (DUF6484)